MKHSEETKLKISRTLKGRKKPTGFGIGRKFSEETKRKISDAHKKSCNRPSFKGRKHSEEAKRKMSLVTMGKAKLPLRGRKLSSEHRNKLSLAKLGIKRGPMSPETRKKLSEIHTKLGSHGPVLFGKDHPAWQGGKSFEPYPVGWTKTLKLAIRQRDNFTCQKCDITEEEHLQKLRRVLSVNHIDFDKSNCDPKNLNTLCISCNVSINTNRVYWTTFFKQRLCA